MMTNIHIDMLDFLEGLGKIIGVALLIIGFFVTIIGFFNLFGSDPNPIILIVGIFAIVIGGILTGTSD